MAARGRKSVDLGYFNGDYPAWDLEADFDAWELSSRHFPSKVKPFSPPVKPYM
jgi:hypothetical protein